MIPNQQQANKILPLISNLEAYDAYLELLNVLHDMHYKALRDSVESVDVLRNQGKLQLIDELKELRDRLKDTVKNGRQLRDISVHPLDI